MHDIAFKFPGRNRKLICVQVKRVSVDFFSADRSDADICKRTLRPEEHDLEIR